MSRPRLRRRTPAAPSTDVIIIGGGLSGLSAALTLHEAGAKCIVLEARDRVGGKSWTREFGGGTVDMGAAWINDTNQDRIYRLVERFGLETIVQNVEGGIVMQDLDGGSHVFPYGGVPLVSLPLFPSPAHITERRMEDHRYLKRRSGLTKWDGMAERSRARRNRKHAPRTQHLHLPVRQTRPLQPSSLVQALGHRLRRDEHGGFCEALWRGRDGHAYCDGVDESDAGVGTEGGE